MRNNKLEVRKMKHLLTFSILFLILFTGCSNQEQERLIRLETPNNLVTITDVEQIEEIEQIIIINTEWQNNMAVPNTRENYSVRFETKNVQEIDGYKIWFNGNEAVILQTKTGKVGLLNYTDSERLKTILSNFK